MALRDWYNSLFVRAYPPVKQLAQGVAHGAGLPASVDEARGMADTALGTMFGIPGAYDAVGQGLGQTVEDAGFAVSHPAETARAAVDAIKADPAGSVGVALGMALPFGIPESEWLGRFKGSRFPRGAPLREGTDAALRFGGKALSSAEKRMSGRVLTERARIHAGLEGKQGPLPDLGNAPAWAESPGDLEVVIRELHNSNTPTEFLMKHADELERAHGHPAAVRALREAAKRRGGPLSNQLHVLHEGPVGKLETQPWTREDRGAGMLQKEGLYQKADEMLDPEVNTFPNDARKLRQKFPDVKAGTAVAWEGERWVMTTRGWTRAGGKPLPKDFDWIFKEQFDKTYPTIYDTKGMSEDALSDLLDAEPELAKPIRESNIERAVELVHQHGGNRYFATEEAAAAFNKRRPNAGDFLQGARTVVAKRISDRMKLGKATTQEIVWFNIHRAGGFKPGGFKWHQ